MRTTEDALRSLKRYLALSLGGPSPLAAAKFFPDPGAADTSAVGATHHLWYDLAHDGSGPAIVQLADSHATNAALGLVPTIFFGGYQWWANPPGRRLSGGVLVGLDPDPSSVSPGMVAGCESLNRPDWSAVLAQPRWGKTIELLSGSSRPYRCAMLKGLPSLTGPTVAADELPDPPEWDVRFFHDEGEFEYPVCVIKTVGPAVAAAHVPFVELTQSYAIYAYPQPPDAGAANASGSQVRAERVRQILITALDASRSNGAKPMRIPLYDYDGVGVGDPAGFRLDSDYLKVVSASVEVMPEPGDPLQAVVVADVRLNWRVATDEGRGVSLATEIRLDLDDA